LSSAADIGTFGRHRDHEAETHHHHAEQDRPGQGESGEGTARPDCQVRSRSVSLATGVVIRTDDSLQSA